MMMKSLFTLNKAFNAPWVSAGNKSQKGGALGFSIQALRFMYCLHVVTQRKKVLIKNTTLEMDRPLSGLVSSGYQKQAGHSSWWGAGFALDGHSTECLCLQSAPALLETLRAVYLRESLSGCQTSSMTLTCDSMPRQPTECCPRHRYPYFCPGAKGKVVAPVMS